MPAVVIAKTAVPYAPRIWRRNKYAAAVFEERWLSETQRPDHANVLSTAYIRSVFPRILHQTSAMVIRFPRGHNPRLESAAAISGSGAHCPDSIQLLLRIQQLSRATVLIIAAASTGRR